MYQRPLKVRIFERVFFSIITAIILPIFWIFFSSGYVSSPSIASRHVMPEPWPPVVGQTYPDLELIDQDGEKFKLSYLKGKVIIVEPIGMNCAACQAFSGGHDYGSFENNPVQQYISSFHKLFPIYVKGLKLPHPDVVVVQLLLYDMKLDAPKPEDAAAWAKHFRLSKGQNYFVAVSPYDMRSPESFKMIPGFQLIGRDFILRADSAGHTPKHDLYRQLIPFIPKLIAQKTTH